MPICLRARVARCRIPSHAANLSRCLSSRSPVPSLPKPEQISLPRPNGGTVTLDVYHPLSILPNQTRPPCVVVYLPRGPFWSNTEHEASTISHLRSALPWHIVQLNYRLAHDHKFPTPIHDVLSGYDWIVKHLLPPDTHQRADTERIHGRVAVCGELIGGGLATALALTECRVGSTGVFCAAISNAIVDWPSVHESTLSPKNKKKPRKTDIADRQSTATREELIQLRTELFGKPERYFDPFASPTLFFRAAGQDVPPPPPVPPPEDDMDALVKIEREEYYRQRSSPSSATPDNARYESTCNQTHATKRAKSSKRFPSPILGLQLPSFHVSAGIESPFGESAAELVHLLRQSFLRQSQHDARNQFGHKILTEDEEIDDEDHLLRLEEAEQKGLLELNPGLGLWDDSPAGRARVSRVAEWLKARLE